MELKDNPQKETNIKINDEIKTKNKRWLDYKLPLIISFLALLISAWSAGLLSPFNLNIYVDSYFLPHTSVSNDYSNSFPIGIPIIFFNGGNKEGIIKDVILLVKNVDTNQEVVYRPIMEIDFQQFLRDKRVLHAENMLAPFFVPFILEKRGMQTKTLIFTEDSAVSNYPYKPLLEGNYEISIIVKTSEENYKRYFNFTFNFTSELMDEYNRGTTEYIGRINFPYTTFKLTTT